MPFKAIDFLREAGPRFAFKADNPTQPLLREDTGAAGAGGARGIGAGAGEQPMVSVNVLDDLP